MNDRPEGERSDRLGGKNQGADLRLRHRSRGLVWGPWSFAEAGALKNGSRICPRNDDLLVGRPRIPPRPSLFALNRRIT